MRSVGKRFLAGILTAILLFSLIAGHWAEDSFAGEWAAGAESVGDVGNSGILRIVEPCSEGIERGTDS